MRHTFTPQWSAVPDKSILLRGQPHFVPAFDLMTYPVKVGNFKEFCKQTGYRTTAELEEDPNIYSNLADYYEVERELGIPVDEQEVRQISYEDAIAFASWIGCQIPTEAQHLAGYVVDWEHIYKDASVGYRALMHKAHIKHHGTEFTSTSADEALPLGDYWNRRWHQPQQPVPNRTASEAASDVTVRGGPVYCLFEGWDKAVLSLRWPRDGYDEHVSFRLVRRE